MKLKDIISVLIEKTLAPAELSKHGGQYSMILLKLAKQGPVEVAPKYHNKYGQFVQLSTDTIQALSDFIETGRPLPKEPMFVIDDNEVKGAWGALQKTGQYTGLEGEKRAYNAGHLSELFMGMAIATKFIKAGDPITYDDVMEFFGQFSMGEHLDRKNKKTNNTQFTLTKMVKYTDVKGKQDQIKIQGVIPAVSANEFIKQNNSNRIDSDLQNLINSAILFVNESGTIMASVDRIKRDPSSNTVAVTSDGTTDSKMTKADLVLSIDGSRVNLFSLKTSASNTLGQISGIKYEALEEWFKTSFDLDIAEYADLFDPDIDKQETLKNVFGLYDDVIYPQIKIIVEDQKPGVEAKIVQRLAHSANLHARGRNMENIDVIKLDDKIAKGGYKVLRFSDSLKDAMRDLDLSAKLLKSGNSRTIQIFVGPHEKLKRNAIWKNLLCQFRTAVMGGYPRNYFEIGDIMVELTEISGSKKDDISARILDREPPEDTGRELR